MARKKAEIEEKEEMSLVENLEKLAESLESLVQMRVRGAQEVYNNFMSDYYRTDLRSSSDVAQLFETYFERYKNL